MNGVVGGRPCSRLNRLGLPGAKQDGRSTATGLTVEDGWERFEQVVVNYSEMKTQNQQQPRPGNGAGSPFAFNVNPADHSPAP